MAKSAQEVVHGSPEMKSLKGDFLKWEEPGEKVEGRVVSRAFIQMRNGVSPKYTVLTNEGKRISFLAPMQVAEALVSVPDGTYISVEYLESVKAAGGTQSYKDFNIMAEEHTPLGHRPGNVDDSGEITSEE